MASVGGGHFVTVALPCSVAYSSVRACLRACVDTRPHAGTRHQRRVAIAPLVGYNTRQTNLHHCSYRRQTVSHRGPGKQCAVTVYTKAAWCCAAAAAGVLIIAVITCQTDRQTDGRSSDANERSHQSPISCTDLAA